MVRGRPLKSEIREKITTILDQLVFSYGYEIYKYYKKLFSNVTSRVIYYHLRKGVENGEFVSVNIKRVLGNFSWGDESERVYYALGPFASTKRKWHDKTVNANIKPHNVEYDWIDHINKKITELKAIAKIVKEKDKEKVINKCDKMLEWTKKKTKDYSEIEAEINSIKTFLK